MTVVAAVDETEAAVVVERLVYFLVKGQVPMVEQADQEWLS